MIERLTVEDLRPEVVAFALLMERALRANDHKGGWRGDDVFSLFRRIEQETAELREALHRAKQYRWEPWDGSSITALPRIVRKRDSGALEQAQLFAPLDFAPGVHDINWIGNEAADVANFAMMVADVAGALAPRP